MGEVARSLPLFERYPRLSALPHLPLGLFPTPVEELPGLGRNDNRVYIKRDDLSGEAYGGNKVRKLEFLLAEAKRQGTGEVLTYGCDGSNHALSTGIYAAKLGMRSISILRTQENAHYLRENLLKSLYYGIELHHYETKEELDAGAREVMEARKSATGRYPYEVPVGGTSPLGTVGFVNAAFELARQVEDGLLPRPDYLYAAAGTNGTVAGLILGLRALGMDTKVIPIRVNDETRVSVPEILQLLAQTVRLLRELEPDFPDLRFREADIPLVHSYFGEGYASFTPEGTAAVRRMWQDYHIRLEGTYTGKTMAALLDAMESRHRGETLVFWNTLNSRPAPADLASAVDYHSLPQGFHRYFEQEVQPLDR